MVTAYSLLPNSKGGGGDITVSFYLGVLINKQQFLSLQFFSEIRNIPAENKPDLYFCAEITG